MVPGYLGQNRGGEGGGFSSPAAPEKGEVHVTGYKVRMRECHSSERGGGWMLPITTH